VVKILGEERTHWTEQRTRTRTLQDGRTESETYTEYFDGHNTFFKVKVLVYNFGGFVQPGQYSFPFSFQVSEDGCGSCWATWHAQVTECVQ
jgi:hypothetical protein